jgi:hypothetical protein
MSDISAGKTEILKGLKVVLTNVQSLTYRTDIARKEELEVALNTLRDVMNLLDDCLEE